MEITVTVTTRGRYYSTLSLCLSSILNQTLLPKEIILVDDNDKKEFYDIQIYKDILNLSKLKNVKFSYYYGQSKGQVYAQQIGLENTETDWIFKTDDDNILSPNTLELLSNSITDKVGAISGLIIGNEKDQNREIESEYNKIDDIFSSFNIQMCGKQNDEIKKVEHLYSNYLFRKSTVDEYPLDFAPEGHREDTVFTYEIFRKGYDLLVNPNVIIYHLHSDGGNRIHKENNDNDYKFLDRLKEWDIVPNKLKIFEDDNIIYMIKDKIKYKVLQK